MMSLTVIKVALSDRNIERVEAASEGKGNFNKSHSVLTGRWGMVRSVGQSYNLLALPLALLMLTRDGAKHRRLGGGKAIYDQLASRFPIFDQLASCCILKSWSIYDHYFGRYEYKDTFCWSVNLLLFDLLVKNA